MLRKFLLGPQFLDELNTNVLWLPEHSLPRVRFDTHLDTELNPIYFRFQAALFGSSGIAQVLSLLILVPYAIASDHEACFI